MKINPQFKPPADYHSSSTKRSKKIYIPMKNYPDYNFIGLIIGPRGLTQKQMEKETGAKIAIRGKGSVKEGKGHQPGEDEDLHVLITGDTKKQIKTAERMVKKLLIPVDEGKNEHKRAQLRKLAEINGTLRDNMWAPTGRTWASSDVYCKYCGEISHPTADCPLKGKQIDREKIEAEYSNFMAEIGVDDGTAAAVSARTDAEKSYEEFMTSLSKPDGSSKSQSNQIKPPWEQQAPMGHQQPQQQRGFFPPPNQMGQHFPMGVPPPWAMHGMQGMQGMGMQGMQNPHMMHGFPQGFPGMMQGQQQFTQQQYK